MTILGRYKTVSSEFDEIVMEKFVGRNFKEFKLIEDELRQIIKIVKANSNAITTSLDISKINESDHNKAIERAFKNFFKVKEVKISWTGSAIPNAYTFCKTYMVFDNNYREDETSRRFNENLYLGIVVNTGLITTANMNEKEILSIMLHEIGHNFYNSFFHVVAMTGISLQRIVIKGALDTINFNKFLSNFGDFIRNFASKNLRPIYLLFSNFNRIMLQISSLFNISMYTIPYRIINFVKNLTTLQFFARYNVEKHADSFAVDHGYGKELASALNKINRLENTLGYNLYDIPVISWIYDLIDVQIEVISTIIGIYPSEQNRIREGLDRLKRNLNNADLSPAVRRELEQQIKEYEEFYRNYYLNIHENQNRNRIFTWLFRNFIDKIFNGKMDIRELIYLTDRTRKS